jgi:enamine deaminase RidA (YjgF/YER057c/UK114 family)
MIERYASGGPWESTYGYSRAVAAGGRVVTAGCTSTVDGVVTHVGDAGAQARQAFRIALDAIADAGVGPEHVVRTRMYVVNRSDADAVGAAHGQIFATVRPAATLVLVAGLLHPDHLVEVEVEAVLPKFDEPERTRA